MHASGSLSRSASACAVQSERRVKGMHKALENRFRIVKTAAASLAAYLLELGVARGAGVRHGTRAAQRKMP